MTETDGLPLFSGPTAVDESHRAAAHRWMDEHPDAMRLFSELAEKAATRGRKFGFKLLVERVRWEFVIERGDETYKLNNNHTAYIGRELVRRNPGLAKWVEFRQTQDAS